MNAFQTLQKALLNGGLTIPNSSTTAQTQTEQAEVKHTNNIVLGSNDTEPDYYKILRVSHSDLVTANRILSGQYDFKPFKAFSFGKALHELILEPYKFDLNSYPADLDSELLYRLRDKIMQNDYCRDLLSGSAEQVALWQENTTGILCKCKTDVAYASMAVDLKTTCATTQAAFEASMTRFCYDLQMAFYGDAIGADEMVIVGISKKNGELFIYHTHTNSDFINRGREQYYHLLNEIKKHNMYAQLFAARG